MEVSEEEANSLAKMLNEEPPHITEDLLRNVFQNRKARFLQFIRHILGLEILASFPETVTRVFDRFIHEHSNLNLRQLEFLRLLKSLFQSL